MEEATGSAVDEEEVDAGAEAIEDRTTDRRTVPVVMRRKLRGTGSTLWSTTLLPGLGLEATPTILCRQPPSPVVGQSMITAWPNGNPVRK